VITTSSGDLIGTCVAEVTESDATIATCSVAVPFGSTVVVTEDISTIPVGYRPTNNPQSFDVPVGPPDGMVGGPVFLNLPVGNTDTALDEPLTVVPDVGFVSEPDWWIVPRAPGWGNTEEGNLYFGALVENPTDTTVHVGLSFRAYEADGTPFPGCHMPGGEGPGVAETIAPGETALIRCNRTIVPNTLSGLQVTAHLWDVAPVLSSDVNVDILETGFEFGNDFSSPMETSYEPFALVRATAGSDVEAYFLFRFYDDSGTQVGTCESNTVTIEPEIAQRVECSFHLTMDTVSPQPVRVGVEPRPSLQQQTAESTMLMPSAQTADDDVGRTLTIYKAECPVGYVGDASADECDANPVSGVPFRIGLPFTDAFTDYVATDDEGLVIFDIDDVAFDGTLRVIESVPSGTEEFVAYCVDESNTALGITYVDYSERNPDIGVVDMAVGTTGDIRCDWYNVPEAS
jgi:hypothetical protein